MLWRRRAAAIRLGLVRVNLSQICLEKDMQHDKTRFGGFFIMEKHQSKHKHAVGKKCCRRVEHFMQPVYCLFVQYL